MSIKAAAQASPLQASTPGNVSFHEVCETMRNTVSNRCAYLCSAKTIKMKRFFLTAALALTIGIHILAQQALIPELHIEGTHFVTSEGKRVILHGFAQTFSPWFNEQGSKWTNYDVEGCLNYNKGIIDGIIDTGWEMTFVRQHMDPYWSNNPGASVTGENDISAFNFERFKTYLDKVFVPMAEYAISKGLYVVMRPPGVCPERISVGDAYQQYLLKVWGYVAQHPTLKNNNRILYELANEPVGIYHSDGSRAGDKEMQQYFQPIADTIRHQATNIILVPGLGWQSQYAGFAKYPIEGTDIGYAVHCYPGWYNGGHGDDDVVVNYRDFKRGWDAQIGPVAAMAPIVVTEMDWAPSRYHASWGKSTTGEAGREGFGANFKRIVDETCNVSWLLFTGGELLARYDDDAPDGNTFLTDPEACPRPCYRWFKEYNTQEFSDLINSDDYGPVIREEPLFSLTEEWFNPSIWEQGSFDEETGCLITGQYGFGGWQYATGADLSPFKYLVVELKQRQSCGASFRLFDENNYWTTPYMRDFNSDTRITIDLHNMVNGDGKRLDPAHIYIAGFWSYGGSPIYIKDIFVSDDGQTPAGIEKTALQLQESSRFFTPDGRPCPPQTKGLQIVREVRADGSVKVFKRFVP